MVPAGWSGEVQVVVTSLLGGVISLVAVEWHRLTAASAPDDGVLTASWGGLGVVFVAIAAQVSLDLDVNRVWATGIAPGSAMAALAAARGAAVLPIGGLREGSAFGVLASLTALSYGLGASGVSMTALASSPTNE